jgi:hypothetical protein
MSSVIRVLVLFAAWLVACIAELRDSVAQAGVNLDEPKAPHQWHGELPLPQPVLLPPEQQPVPRMLNNSMMAAAQACEEQENRNALFTMEVARKNLRNAALFTLLNHPPAA